MKQLLSLLIGIAFIQIAIAQNSDIMLPAKMPREQIIHHKAFSLSYSSAYVLSTWLSYKVTNSEVNKSEKIKAKYLPDPNITTRAADKKDYKDAGYLMAQLCSYLDVMHINGAVEETFYMTNIAPMKLAFYQHIWLKTEDLIRLWLKEKKELQIFTGSVTKEAPFPTFGKNKVSIPKHFYKVVYSAKNNEAVAFFFKNGMSSGTLKSKTITVEKLEEMTGIDFFPELDEEIKKKMKSEVNYKFWNFELEDEL